MVPIINVTSIRWVLTATSRICLFNFEVTNCLIVIIPRKELFEDIINIFLLIIPGIIILYNYITYQNHFHRYYKSVHKVKVLKLTLHNFLFKYTLYSKVQVSEETFHLSQPLYTYLAQTDQLSHECPSNIFQCLFWTFFRHFSHLLSR